MSLKEEYRILRHTYRQYKKNRKQEREYINWLIDESPRLRKFGNKFQGEDCFIVGNGPSLNKMDLSVLNDYYTFGLNKIHLIFERSEFRPKFMVSVNKHVIDQSLDDILSINVPTFVSYTNCTKRVSHPNLFYLFSKGGLRNGFVTDLTQEISEGGTVTFIAMQVAYYLGFHRVFLIGVDHNFIQKGKANSEEVLKSDDVNHFDPNYFKGQKWNLADLESSELGYHHARYHYSMYGRSIFNATVDGKLQVYPKISFEEAVKMAKKINN
jgi:hypothetical protein